MGDEAASVQVEPRLVEPQVEAGSTTELIRSMALSSAELWNDVLQRLSELQESQIVLAKAIAELGSMVRESIVAGAPPAVAAGTPERALAAGSVDGEPEVAAAPTVEPGPIPGGFDAGPIGFAVDPVGPLPEDVVAAFYPPEVDVAPWYKRRLTFSRHRRQSAPRDSASVAGETPSLPPPQVLPPPPPLHLLDRYVFDATPAAPSAPSMPDPPLPPPPTVVEQKAAPMAVSPVLAPEPEVPATPPTPSVLFPVPIADYQAPVAEVHPSAAEFQAPVAEVHLPVAPEPLAPQALVYTPSNAETAMPFVLDEPAAPVAIPFELDPPQGSVSQDLPVAPPVQWVPPVQAETPVPGPPAPPVANAPVEAPPAPEVPPAPLEAALAGALAGRPVVEAQMSVSLATEILGSAAAAAPLPPPPGGEPTPLVISEDLTLVSKDHRKRRQFRFR